MWVVQKESSIIARRFKDNPNPIEYIAGQFELTEEQLGIKELLIGYISVGSWGCDSSAWFLFEDTDGNLKEVHASHCSCYGFEDQWVPKDTSITYLKSDNFYFSCGGYDDSSEGNKLLVKEYISNMKGK